MAAKFLAPSSSPSLRHLIAIIFVYLVLNFKINTPQDVRRDSTPLFRPERSIFLVSVPEQAQVTIVKQHVRKKNFSPRRSVTIRTLLLVSRSTG